MGLLSDAGCPAVADPGARLVAAAHADGIPVVPLVGPSSPLLALMASGMNGQGFAFHGYLPVKAEARAEALRRIEADSARTGYAQLFIETPYRTAAMLAAVCATCKPATRLALAADLTLPTERNASRTIAAWRGDDPAALGRPARAVRAAGLAGRAAGAVPVRAVRARGCGGGRDAAGGRRRVPPRRYCPSSGQFLM